MSRVVWIREEESDDQSAQRDFSVLARSAFYKKVCEHHNLTSTLGVKISPKNEEKKYVLKIQV